MVFVCGPAVKVWKGPLPAQEFNIKEVFKVPNTSDYSASLHWQPERSEHLGDVSTAHNFGQN